MTIPWPGAVRPFMLLFCKPFMAHLTSHRESAGDMHKPEHTWQLIYPE